VNRPVRRVALYGYLGSGNLGNDASLETTLAWLRYDHPDVEVECITIAPDEIAARYGVPSIRLAWRTPHQSSSRVKETLRKLLGRAIDVPRSYALAGSVDAVIVPGMGVLEERLGERPWGLPLGLFLMSAACRLRRRRFLLLDVGAERAVNPLTRRLYVATTRLATHVSYRDRSSAAAMEGADAHDHAAIAPDLAFAHPATTLAKPEPGRIVVGVMAYYGRKDDPKRGADVRRRYVATMASALAHIAAAGNHVVLVGGDWVDVDVARDVQAAVLTVCPSLSDDAVVVREFTTFTDLTEEMMRAEVVIASRFHNVICALRLARPTISVGYASKNRHLMEGLGLDEYCQEIENLDAGQLVAQVRAAQEDAGKLEARIRGGTGDYTAEVQCLLSRVASEALGLAAPRRRELERQGEMDAWHG
jgi:polysaccharide pyruvyl transferase WcaK-like protein